MAEWLTIEVADAVVPASAWRRAHGEDLVETAVTHGAVYWDWHETRWGVVLELVFPDDERLDRFRRLPALLAALDAAPDPVHGLALYRGRGGASGARVPRHPGPRLTAGAAAWPLPDEERFLGTSAGRYDLAAGDQPETAAC
jgi:hypothetical protein